MNLYVKDNEFDSVTFEQAKERVKKDIESIKNDMLILGKNHEI